MSAAYPSRCLTGWLFLCFLGFHVVGLMHSIDLFPVARRLTHNCYLLHFAGRFSFLSLLTFLFFTFSHNFATIFHITFLTNNLYLYSPTLLRFFCIPYIGLLRFPHIVHRCIVSLKERLLCC